MLPQTNFFGKWKRTRPVLIILLAGLLFTAVILTTLSQSETFNYLPVIFNNGIPGTPPPACDVQFVSDPVAGNNEVLVTDDVGRIVSIVNLTTGETMGTDQVEPAGGYDCPGLADYAPPYQLSGAFTAGHELQAQSDDGGGDTVAVPSNPTNSPPPPGISAAAVLTTATPGPTPAPPDLRIIGTPALISTPPIVAYQPVQFTAVISNAGDTGVNSQFFVDLFIDPTVVFSYSIPITESDGYSAISSLTAQSTRVVTLTALLGFGNEPPVHLVYAMIDSYDQINEPGHNNLSTPAVITNVTPAPTPTATNTPSPGGDIAGLVYLFGDGFHPQFRAALHLIDNASGQTIATAQSDAAGHYQFTNLPGIPYTVVACIIVDGQSYFGYRNGIIPPLDLAYISLTARPCP